MKAILVIDMPNECVECSQYESYDCRILQQNVCLCITQCRRHENCPLKPMPQEQDIYEIGMDEEDTNAKRQWNKGWNACLDEITGETE